MPTVYLRPSQDAFVTLYGAEQNYGREMYLYAGRYQGPGDIYRSMLQFDLGSLVWNGIPFGSTIESAVLNLLVYRNEIKKDAINLQVYKILQSWDEEKVNWNSQPLFANIAEGSTRVASGFFGRVAVDVTEFAADWFSGKVENNGLMLKGWESSEQLLGFYSQEAANSSFRPMLQITYVGN